MTHVKVFLSPSRHLPQVLPSNHGEVMGLVIGNLAAPHDEDDLQPFRAERSHGLVMALPPRALLGVVRSRPVTLPQGEERQQMHGMTQVRVAREAEPHDLLLTTARGDGHGPGMGLQVLEGLPAPGGIAQFGPQGRHRGPALSGMAAKKWSTASRYSATARTTAVSSSTSTPTSRALARTTCAGTGSWGGRSVSQSAAVRAALSRCVRAQRCQARGVSAATAWGVG